MDKHIPIDARQGARDLASLADDGSLFAGSAREKLESLLDELRPLAERYDVVVANPPYMGSNNMSGWLNSWSKKHYPETCKDLCTCFIKRGMSLATNRGYEAQITSDTCMYISSFEKMRKMVIDETSIIAFTDTRGTNAHPDVFDANAGWVLWLGKREGLEGAYFKLNQPIAEKEARYLEALANPECGWFYLQDAETFSLIPGSPIAYWLSQNAIASFENPLIGDSIASSTGMKTGDNDQFLRLWWEIPISSAVFDASSADAAVASKQKWFPYNKGGDYRKWYGNEDTVINWMNDGYEIKNPPEGTIRHYQLIKREWMFRPHVTWTKISSTDTSFRFKDRGQLFDMAGASMIPANREDCYALTALCNSSVAKLLLRVLAPTLNYQSGDIAKLPIVLDETSTDATSTIAASCIAKSKNDWDESETSWCFNRHPLV